MDSDEYLARVREQYENYPYPKRSPEDEERTLFVTTTEHLGNISHYCFGGKRDLRDGARCLVAGGGTGDAAIYLSEQLRYTNSEVVYIDLSQASMDIARERAEVRGLTNITWLQRSLLELPNMDIGTFDYINCCGVLHHLDDPVKGLNALSSVLRKDGAMGIMVYAQYGRTAVYQMQELMRLINADENNLQQCIDNTHLTIAELPEENWYRRDEARWKDDLEKLGDIELYDLFLHSQDRAYTVPQVYNWLDECGLNLVSFTGFAGHKLKYTAETYIKNKKLRDLIDKSSIKQQQSIAELISGSIKTHTFYASKQKNTMADRMSYSMVPFYSFEFAPAEVLFNDLSKNPTQTLELNLGGKIDNLKLELGNFTRYILRYLDGNRSLGEIVQCIKNDFMLSNNHSYDEKSLLVEYSALFEIFHSYELMFVRDKEIKPYKTYAQLVAETISRNLPNIEGPGID